MKSALARGQGKQRAPRRGAKGNEERPTEGPRQTKSSRERGQGK